MSLQKANSPFPNLKASLPSIEEGGYKCNLLGLVPKSWEISATPEQRYCQQLSSPQRLSSYGVTFELSADNPILLKEALGYLPLGCQRSALHEPVLRYHLSERSLPSRKANPAFRLHRSGKQLFTGTDQQQLLERLHAAITLDVAERSRDLTFIHAGVVAWQGAAIVIPGRSFSGKTTLVAAFLRAGATYYSDEFALVDKLGMVHSYPRSLQVREGGDRRQTSHPVEAFGAIAGHTPLPVKLILVSRFKPEGHWRPQELSPGLGLLKLLDNTVSARGSPAIALHNLKQAVVHARIVRSVRGEASQVVQWVTTQVNDAGRRAEENR